MITFEEMPYERPDLDKVKAQLEEITEELKNASSYEEAKTAFLKMDEAERHFMTTRTIASIRHDINTKDEFYKEEEKFWNAAGPQMQEYLQNYTKADRTICTQPQREDAPWKCVFRAAGLAVRTQPERADAAAD